MPAALEKRFLGELVQAVKEVKTSPDLVVPDMESIISGLNRKCLQGAPGQAHLHHGRLQHVPAPTIYPRPGKAGMGVGHPTL